MDYQQILQEQMKETLDADAFDALTKQVAEYSGGMAEDFSLDSIVASALKGEALFDSQVLIENLKSLFLYEVRSALLLGVQILTVCIAIGLLQSLGTSFGKKSLSSIGQLVCTMVIIGIAVSSFRLIYTLSLDTVSTMVNTMALVMPVLLGILIATGSIASGTILQPMMLGAVTGFGVLIKTIILPALFASTMLSLINCLTEKNYVNQLSRLIRNAALIVTGLILAILSGIFSVQGLLTDTSDGLLINAARYSLSTFIPIVGGFTADTVDLFLRCMRSIKGIVGVFGILMLVLLTLVPLLKMLACALIYKLTAAVTEPVTDSKIPTGLSDMGNCLISMTAIVFFTALLFIIFISIIVGIGGG